MMISIRIIIILLILLILQPGIPAAIMTNFAPITLQFSFPSFFPWNNFHLPCPSLCCCSVPQECHTLCESDPWTAALQASLSFTIFWILLKLMSIESVMSSNHLIVHCPLLFLSSIFPSIRVCFPMSFSSNVQSIGASASASVLLMNIQGWFPLGLTGLISLQSKGLSRVFSSTRVQKHQFVGAQPSLWSNSHITTGKHIILTRWAFVGKVMSLLLNMLSRFIIAFLSRSQASLNFMAVSLSAVILEPRKIKSLTVSPSVSHEVMRPDAMILFFECWALSQLFHSPPSPF